MMMMTIVMYLHCFLACPVCIVLVQYFAAVLMGMIFLWFKAANSLAGQFNEAMEANPEKA
jgi:hypothetical protein